MDRITQDDLDALWLACRVTINVGDVPRNLRGRAQLRLQRLVEAGVATQQFGGAPVLATGERG